MKKSIGAFICALLLLALTGCDNTSFLFRSPESLFALPQLSEEYTSLQAQLKELLDSGMEYSPPLSGDNTQPVHLRDLTATARRRLWLSCGKPRPPAPP